MQLLEIARKPGLFFILDTKRVLKQPLRLVSRIVGAAIKLQPQFRPAGWALKDALTAEFDNHRADSRKLQHIQDIDPDDAPEETELRLYEWPWQDLAQIAWTARSRSELYRNPHVHELLANDDFGLSVRNVIDDIRRKFNSTPKL